MNKGGIFIKISHPLLIYTFILIFTVLFIPTVLVLPYMEKPGLNTVESLQNNNDPVLANNKDSINVSVLRTNSGKIEKLSLEDYVVGVVASEMPANFEQEALKAQAVAARTYTIKFLSSSDSVAKPSKVNVDITDNPKLHQVYKNKSELMQLWKKDYESNIKKIENAVKSTAGQILVYNNKPIDALFFSTSNGLTENSEDYWEYSVPYLKSVNSEWDKQHSPKFQSQITYNTKEFSKTLGLEYKEPVISDVTKTAGNRVKTIKINGITFSGKEIRDKLNLSSADFNISLKKGQVIINSTGNGHGVGMSQYGANGMAIEGKKYTEILYHYYRDVDIATTNNFIDSTNKEVVKN